MNDSDKFTGLDQENDSGPMKSVEGYTLAVTGLHGEVSDLRMNI